MVSFFDVLKPSFILFPALLGSGILAFVCPLVGAHLMLRRRIFLGLTLPQIAACGVAFTFWLAHLLDVTHGSGHERLMAMAGSLLFTLVGMGLLAYLDRHGSGSPEGRLAAAYAFASALTILFVVFNPAGELEILNLLKGEVISLSTQELKILAIVYGLVYSGLVLFRREFLLNSFDRDLSFLLTGGGVQWSFWLYVLCGFSIAIGVIMAGPLLVFGFMVLPPLAARVLAPGMSSFLGLSSVIGLLMAIFGFYFSIRLDLPLGPTDVALGCAIVFILSLAKNVWRRWSTGLTLFSSIFLLLIAGCTTAETTAKPAVAREPVWIATVRNQTHLTLRYPSGNPLRSMAEMAGKVPAEEPVTVMTVLRDNLRQVLVQHGNMVEYPENKDMRLSVLPLKHEYAAELARTSGLTGSLLMAEITRWDFDVRGLVRARVNFKFIRIADGSVHWERAVQKFLPASATGNLADSYNDAIKQVIAELF